VASGDDWDGVVAGDAFGGGDGDGYARGPSGTLEFFWRADDGSDRCVPGGVLCDFYSVSDLGSGGGGEDCEMTEDAHDSVRRKVREIFTELVEDRARMLEGGRFPGGVTSTITAALSGSDESEEKILRADQIAFHLTDWGSDAAFIVALHLFPERFTLEEIEAAVDMFLVHVPAHVIAAARLAGHSVEDVFQEDG